MLNWIINTFAQILLTWYLNLMVTHNMLSTHKGKKVFSEKKNPIGDCFRSNQMPQTDKITEIAPYVRTCYWVTINSIGTMIWLFSSMAGSSSNLIWFPGSNLNLESGFYKIFVKCCLLIWTWTFNLKPYNVWTKGTCFPVRWGVHIFFCLSIWENL